MIVQKKQNEQSTFVPDIPEGLEYKSATYRPESDDYLITFSPEQLEANRITAAQGRTQLSREGKLQQIADHVAQSQNEELQIFWEYATFWDKTTPIIKQFLQAFGIDVEDFWTKAKSIAI